MEEEVKVGTEDIEEQDAVRAAVMRAKSFRAKPQGCPMRSFCCWRMTAANWVTLPTTSCPGGSAGNAGPWRQSAGMNQERRQA